MKTAKSTFPLVRILVYLMSCTVPDLLGAEIAPGEIGFAFSEGLARVYDSRYFKDSRTDENGKPESEILGKFGYINYRSELIIPFLYERAEDFKGGMAVVAARRTTRSDALSYGYINKSGEEVIPLQFSDARNFVEGVAPVEKGQLWGFINDSGKFLLSPIFSDARCFSEGLAAVKRNDLWGFVDKSGKFVIEPRFGDAGRFLDGAAAVQLPGQTYWGFINKNGDLIITCEYTGNSAEFGFSAGFANCWSQKYGNEKNYLIDKSGKPGLRLVAGTPVGSFSEDRIVVKNDEDKYGYADQNGNMVVQFMYDKAFAFSEGLAAVIKDGKCGFIDIHGKVILPFEYKIKDREFHFSTPSFSGGLAPVEGGFINRGGNFEVKIGNSDEKK